ncbi:MAG TPA: nucleotide pyrophosphatase/phosphodiesterase family protein [Vicinamibacterales bacterium]|nr:nucleotide pyrophosphatase/phosphodiesterase family protein [Vicinamibacterales bacterium]
MQRTAVLNVVGLTPQIIAQAEHAPHLWRFAASGASAQIDAAFPAVTCTAQADYLTGVRPHHHGIVGNGWYSRDDCEIKFWKQANRLVQAPKVWDKARAVDPSFTCANLFWWYNMYSSVDYSVTPRPMYLADGRKLPDVYSSPADLRDELQSALGQFPLFDFWGPRASIASTKWIAESAKHVETRFSPTLSLVYLPHLDYNLQRVGPSVAAAVDDVRQIDAVCGDLIAFFERRGVRVVVLSEYGLVDVTTPVHLNRVLRQHGLIAVRRERGLELLDPGASAAFAVADHQVAHIYVNDASRLSAVRSLIESTPGVERVLDDRGKAEYGIDHERAGDLVAVAGRHAWFTYYYWMDDALAPDFARTVDIHRKPGYDPVELFLDPAIAVPALTVGWKLAKRSLGFRTLLDVIPLDATLVKGSHGRRGAGEDGPLVMTRQKDLLFAPIIPSVGVHDVILSHLEIAHGHRS